MMIKQRKQTIMSIPPFSYCRKTSNKTHRTNHLWYILESEASQAMGCILAVPSVQEPDNINR